MVLLNVHNHLHLAVCVLNHLMDFRLRLLVPLILFQLVGMNFVQVSF